MAKGFVHQRSKRGCGLKFKLETYRAVTKFTPGTRVKYGPNPKSKSSKSFARYAGYMKAKTVGEALKLGTRLADICWELERGQLKLLGGALSEKDAVKALGKKHFEQAQAKLQSWLGPRGLSLSLDDARAGDELEREETWREEKLQHCEKLARGLGLTAESTEDIEAMGIHESTDLRFERRVADALCERKLREATKTGKKITAADVCEVLRVWGFVQNEGRVNVLPEGKKYVYSDTLGVIKRRTGEFGITPPTRHYPNMARLLCRWLTDNKLSVRTKFVCTAINLNANYAARTHRDQNNEGPSVIRAFGDFKGGQLLYWPGDGKRPRPAVESLRREDAARLDIQRATAIFDGNRAHAVESFSGGDRYSIVFFTSKGYGRAKAAQVKKMQKLGFPWPTPKAMVALRKAAGSGAKVAPALLARDGA